MKTLRLAKPWKYRTVERTVDYPAGEHEVSNETYAAALAEGAITEETSDGDGDTASRPARPSRKA